MTQLHFTLNNEEVQSIIEHSVKDDVSRDLSKSCHIAIAITEDGSL